MTHRKTHEMEYPIKSSIIHDWDKMEKIWCRTLHDYLRCEPEETVVVLTESPLNPPENREKMAEIMFETFGVKGLSIQVQATMALYS